MYVNKLINILTVITIPNSEKLIYFTSMSNILFNNDRICFHHVHTIYIITDEWWNYNNISVITYNF